LDAVNPGKWFGEQFGKMIGAEKTLVQKSGYFSRAAAANQDDLHLIKSCVDLAVECALRRESGVIGHDEDQGGRLRAIEFSRIKGGKPFDPETPGSANSSRGSASPRSQAPHETLSRPRGWGWVGQPSAVRPPFPGGLRPSLPPASESKGI